MKILHVFDHSVPLHSGYTFRSRNILLEQRKLGIETCHVTSPKQGECENDYEEVDGLSFYRSRLPNGAFSTLPVLREALLVESLKQRLRQVIQIEKPNIIHAHSPALNGLAALSVAKQFNLPVVYEIRAFWEDAAVDHGTCKEGDLRYRLTRMLENFVIKRASHVTMICKGLKNDLMARGFNKNKMTEIPNAVDIEKFIDTKIDHQRIEQIRHDYKLTNKTVLGFIGSFYAYEGLDILISAVKQIVVSGRKDIKLLLVGGGPKDKALKLQVNELDLGDVVEFAGRVPHDDVNNYYENVDLLVFPRKSMRLTELVTPLKPLEAMAQRKLVLASDVGGHNELIDNGITGFLFDADNVVALATAIESIFDNELQHDVIRQNGVEFVNRERTWKASVARYPKVYSELADRVR